jgi:hypothetical protein
MECREARDRAITKGELIFTMDIPEIMYEFVWTDRLKGKGTWRYHTGKYWIYVDESQVMNPTYDSNVWGSHPAGTEPMDVLPTLNKERVLKYTNYRYPDATLSPQGV